MLRSPLRWSVIAAALVLAISCGDESSTTEPDANKPLSFAENQLLGLWSRYRSSNARTEYLLFKSDKTACYFEIGNSNWTKLTYKPYSSWDIDDDHPISSAVYSVSIPASGLTAGYTFDYPSNKLFPTGFDLVIYTRDNTINSALTCSP